MARYAIVDTETLAWATGETYRSLQDVPSCWVHEGTLVPEVRGLGVWLVYATARMLDATPLAGFTLVDRIKKFAIPAPAYVFRVPNDGC